MIKKINTLSLKVGMYVVQYGRGTPGDPYVFVERPVLALEDVKTLVPRGVSEVMIDTDFDFKAFLAERAAEEEAKRRAQEQAAKARGAEEARRKAEADAEAKRRAEEEHLRAEAEALRSKEEDLRLAVEDARRSEDRMDEEERRGAEAETRARLEAAAAIAASAEQPRKTWTVPLVEELPVADKLYGEAIEYTRDFLEDVRHGRPIDHKSAIPLVDSVIESVFRNESALSSLCKLRRFDEYSYTHSLNVGVLAVVLGRQLGLGKPVLRLLGIAGLFHDVGKALIPKAILNKPGRLSPSELTVMRTHPIEGWHVMKAQKGIHPEALAAVIEHHERFDGKGYPRGLRGEEIGVFSRVIGVVDVYDALTSQRVYKEPTPPARVLSLMYQWRTSDFFPGSVENFIKCLGVYPVGSLVQLTNGEHAVVMELNPATPIRPKVRVLFDAKMRPRPMRTLDLAEAAVVPGRKPIEIWKCLNPLDYKIDVVRLMG